MAALDDYDDDLTEEDTTESSEDDFTDVETDDSCDSEDEDEDEDEEGSADEPPSRVPEYLERVMAGDDPLKFFRPWELDKMLYTDVLEWMPCEVRALGVYVSFGWHKAPTLQAVFDEGRKPSSATVSFNWVTCPRTKLQQLRRKKKSSTKTDTFLLFCVQDCNDEHFSCEQYDYLNSIVSKDKSTRSSDERLLDLLKKTSAGIEKGDGTLKPVVYKNLIGRVGQACVPKSRQWVRDQCRRHAQSGK